MHALRLYSSGGSYGSVDATRYCMTVTDFGGNYLSFGRNETDEAESDRRYTNSYTFFAETSSKKSKSQSAVVRASYCQFDCQ